jgi:undecaprenyl-diphosphatase
MHFFDMIDLAALFWFQSQHRPWLDSFMKAITVLGDQFVMAGVVLAAFAVLLLFAVAAMRRHPGPPQPLAAWQVRTGLCLLLCACLAAGLSEGVKHVVKRVRPDVGFAVVQRPNSGSFPSGHATLSMAIYGALALAAARHLTRRSHRILVLTAAGILILLIGTSRMYLGVHYVTDVVGGWLAGGACALLFLWLDQRWGWVPERDHSELAAGQVALVPAAAPQGPGTSEQILSRGTQEQFRP